MKRPTADPSAASGEQSREQVRQQFLTACASHGDGPPPDPDSFVVAFPEPERSALRSELEALQREHAHPTTSDANGETQDYAGDATAEHIPAPAVPQMTIDHEPAPPPQATVDHAPPAAEAVQQVRRKPRLKDLPVPESVAGYEVIEVLGRGAMGVVYKARQRGLKRLVALKMILSGAHASEQDLARFRAEANAVADLKHPGIVQLYEFGEDEGRPFFSLEFIDGPSLHKKIQGTPLPPREAAALLKKMAEAMAYAHEHHIIHRDLKPANVLMTQEGEPKIGDFGLAKQIEQQEDAGLTRTGTVLGTPSYMSPEQAEGRIGEVGPLADVYSLGAILYDMLTGRPPFRGTSVLDTLEQLRTQEPVPPMQFQPGVPRDLETICLKCLQKDRTRRYGSARELAEDVRRFLAGEPIKARPVSSAERAWRWCRRNPRAAVAIGASIAVLVIYAATFTVMSGWLKVEKDRADEKTALAEQQTKVALANVEIQRQTAQQALEGTAQVGGNMIQLLQTKGIALAGDKASQARRAQLIANFEQSFVNVSRRIQAVATDTYADVAFRQVYGDLMMKLGRPGRAREVYLEGHKSVADRLAKDPENDRARANLGLMEMRLGDLALEGDGDPRSAKQHYLEARRLREETLRQPRGKPVPPIEAKRNVSHDDVRVGRALLALGQPDAARSYFQEALAYREEWLGVERVPKEINAARSFIVEAQMWLGTAAWHLSDADAVARHFGAALKIHTQLMTEKSESVNYRIDMVEVQGAHGDALVRLGKLKEAHQAYKDSLANLQGVLDKQQGDMSNQPLAALAHERLGIVLDLLTQKAEANKHHRLARQLRLELWAAERDNKSRQAALLVALARAGDYGDAERNGKNKRGGMVKSPEQRLQVARCFALCVADPKLDRKANIAQALSALDAAIGEDYKDARALETDPDLAPLRSEPGFQKLVARIKAR